MSSLDSCLDQGTSFWICGQVKWRMYTSVSQLQIDTELHEAFQNFDLRVCGGLMDAIIAMDVDQ